MEEQSQSQSQPTKPPPKGVPRLSKLPVPGQSSSLASSSKLPIPRSHSIRPSPSRETLAVGGGGTLRNPKLRPAPSRDQLVSHASHASHASQASSSHLSVTSTPQSRAQPNTAAASGAPTATTPSRAIPSPHTRAASSNTPASASRTPRYNSSSVAPPLRLARAGSSQQQPSQPSRTLQRRPSQQWISASSVGVQEEETPVFQLLDSRDPAGLDDDSLFNTVRASASKPRPSLAERTIETLSQLPSSPSVKGKAGAASFYDLGSARKQSSSRPPSRASRPPSRPPSRPGSSHHSDGSGKEASQPGSRPGSSSGPSEGISSFQSSISTYKNSLQTIEGTPLRNRQSFQSLRQPSIRTTSTKTIRSSLHGPQSLAAPGTLPARTPSPEKEEAVAPIPPVPKYGAKTLGARPATKRPSINGLFKKPSVSALNKIGTSETSRKVSSGSQWSSAASSADTTRSSASAVSASTAITAGSGDTSRKSSSALREQIARAKAAKRAAALQLSASANPVTESDESPLIPTDNTFDFGLANDPFSQRRDHQSRAKVLQGRLESARTSGRLNIAAMGLKEIPAEVMNMYNLESIGQSGGAWAESVDLSRFVAADNELEMIADSVFPDVDPQSFADDEDSQGNIFAGLETLDLHGNMLITLPMGLRRMQLLTSLNLSQNRLANNCLEVISLITPLRDLKLGGNLLYGPLDPCFSNLVNLEILDLHGNNIASLPSNLANITRLRVLNISENAFETLPFEILATLPLTELVARKNQLKGTLIPESVESLPSLKNLDVSLNQLSHICSPAVGKSVSMLALAQLTISVNRLQALPDVSSWTSLHTLAADENSINAIPEGFTSLQQLRSADLSSNDIRVIPPEIGRMEKLAMLRLSGNPLREKKFSSMDTDEMKAILASRLEPPPAHLQPEPELELTPEPTLAGPASHSVDSKAAAVHNTDEADDANESDQDDFATPPTSAPGSPARSRSHTLTGQTWPVRSGGILDRSNTQSSSLHPVICSKVAAASRVNEIQLHHNLFTALPESLSFFAETLTTLSLAHNQLVGETYLGSNEGLFDLPALKELNLANNHISGLGPLVAHLRMPNLQKIDVSFNRISALPAAGKLREAFPNLTVLLMSNNHLAELDPEAIRGLRIVDVGNNDIAHLNPRLGLLGGSSGGLEKFEVGGNRFRVPRYNVLERGTEATLRWLRGRVPVAEMAAWKGEEGDTSIGDLD
ncbi:hypothetical protein B0T17DRAFT_644648 [Bombardia bombarda]|uniref:Leucine-rich repeat-containing protein 40 n=1 Tax=Bombardia bombarda TaxID=252184 RepID=A0AA39WHQ4_9PEZI|nr:hypothetical protein B0T17DRAFT_644648 [Bombardia bombarda]